MAAIPLCATTFAAFKKSLRDEFPDVKSSHLGEALAYSMGFRTNAALSAAMAKPDAKDTFVVLDSHRMLERLQQLGYPDDPEFDFELTLLWHPTPGVVSTMPDAAYELEYRTARQKAWRNLMVCAVNAALDQKLFNLRPGSKPRMDSQYEGCVFDFTLPNGLAARGYIADMGHDEVTMHATVNPKGDRVRGGDAGFSAGDAFGAGWVERQNGVWLQSADTQFNCRKWLLPSLVELDIKPKGYGDRGPVM